MPWYIWILIYLILSAGVAMTVGLFLSGIFFLFGLTEKQVIAVIAVLVFEIIITGGLHLDGLADSGDGLAVVLTIFCLPGEKRGCIYDYRKQFSG